MEITVRERRESIMSDLRMVAAMGNLAINIARIA